MLYHQTTMNGRGELGWVGKRLQLQLRCTPQVVKRGEVNCPIHVFYFHFYSPFFLFWWGRLPLAQYDSVRRVTQLQLEQMQAGSSNKEREVNWPSHGSFLLCPFSPYSLMLQCQQNHLLNCRYCYCFCICDNKL